MKQPVLTAWSAVLLLIATMSLRRASLPATRRVVSAAARAFRTRRAPYEIVDAIARATRHVPWQVTCLHEALAGEALLKANGHGCELRIGARRETGSHRFHAWLDCDGTTVIGGSDLGHTVMSSRA